LGAWSRRSDLAWLVVAADLALVDRETLAVLIAARDSTKDATAFRHADGTPEPLCTIWEPRARPAVEGAPHGSLRALLAGGNVAFAVPPDPERLVSVNTPADDERVRQRIAARR